MHEAERSRVEVRDAEQMLGDLRCCVGRLDVVRVALEPASYRSTTQCGVSTHTHSFGDLPTEYSAANEQNLARTTQNRLTRF
jgi:hypothetical protein